MECEAAAVVADVDSIVTEPVGGLGVGAKLVGWGVRGSWRALLMEHAGVVHSHCGSLYDVPHKRITVRPHAAHVHRCNIRSKVNG